MTTHTCHRQYGGAYKKESNSCYTYFSHTYFYIHIFTHIFPHTYFHIHIFTYIYIIIIYHHQPSSSAKLSLIFFARDHLIIYKKSSSFVFLWVQSIERSWIHQENMPIAVLISPERSIGSLHHCPFSRPSFEFCHEYIKSQQPALCLCVSSGKQAWTSLGAPRLLTLSFLHLDPRR